MQRYVREHVVGDFFNGTFDGAGDRSITGTARAAAYRLDPRTVTARVLGSMTGSIVAIWPRNGSAG